MMVLEEHYDFIKLMKEIVNLDLMKDLVNLVGIQFEKLKFFDNFIQIFLMNLVNLI